MRPRGVCPRGTPGCIYSDCGPQPGRSCYGGAAPRHIDMEDSLLDWPDAVERRSPWRLFLDRLGLRSKGPQLANHPDRSNPK